MSAKGKVKANKIKRARNIPVIERFCEDFGLDCKHFNNGLMIRVDGVLDVYTASCRTFNLEEKEWDSFTDYEGLREIFFRYF